MNLQTFRNHSEFFLNNNYRIKTGDDANRDSDITKILNDVLVDVEIDILMGEQKTAELPMQDIRINVDSIDFSFDQTTILFTYKVVMKFMELKSLLVKAPSTPRKLPESRKNEKRKPPRSLSR